MIAGKDDAERVSDEQLFAAFLSGDESGFARLVQRYTREIYNFIARIVREATVADDVTQETFLQVYQSAEKFDLSRRFRPWLYTIAVNKARDALRVRRRHREVSINGTGGGEEDSASYLDFLADDTLMPDERFSIDERHRIVRAVIDEMPEHLREILVLSYFHQFPYKELSDVLSIPLGTVKSRLHAAVKQFARAYKQREQTEQGGQQL